MVLRTGLALKPRKRQRLMDNLKLTPSAFAKPAVMLSGTVDYAMYGSFRGQFVMQRITAIAAGICKNQ